MVDYKRALLILIKITAWFFKFGLVVLGAYLLLFEGYALYFRAIGFIAVVVGLVTFNTVRARLLANRGIRIPNVVVAILLIGGVILIVLIAPGASDIDLTGESAEINDGTFVFSVNATNTADGPTLSDVYLGVELRVDDDTLSERSLGGQTFNRGETKQFRLNLFSLDSLDAAERTQVDTGNYEIIISLDNSEGSDDPRTVSYSGNELLTDIEELSEDDSDTADTEDEMDEGDTDSSDTTDTADVIYPSYSGTHTITAEDNFYAVEFSVESAFVLRYQAINDIDPSRDFDVLLYDESAFEEYRAIATGRSSGIRPDYLDGSAPGVTDGVELSEIQLSAGTYYLVIDNTDLSDAGDLGAEETRRVRLVLSTRSV